MRVLRISHFAAVPVYRARERALVARHPLDLVLVIPDSWPHLGGGLNTDEAQDKEEPFPVARLRLVGAGCGPLFLFNPLQLSAVIKTYRPDIVDIELEPYSAACFQCVWLARRLHPAAALLFYAAQNQRKTYPPPFSWTERYVYRTCQAAYPVSAAAQKVLFSKGFDKPAPVIPLGVDPQLFTPSTGEAKERCPYISGKDRFQIGAVARLDRQKGIDVLIKALTRANLNGKWKLVVAGDGPLRGTLMQMVLTNEIASKVEFLGELPAAQVPQLLRSCDLIVVPSTTYNGASEQFGRIAVEAMSCGVPLIVSDSGELPQVVGEAAAIVPERDAQALAAEIERLAQDSSLREGLKRKGMERARQLYSWDVIADMMYGLYSSVLK